MSERSPLTFVEKIQRPLLIGQGANDPRVKQAEADQIVTAMQEKKIPVTYVLFPDEGHGFARPENNLAFYAVTEAFLAKHLGGRYRADRQRLRRLDDHVSRRRRPGSRSGRGAREACRRSIRPLPSAVTHARNDRERRLLLRGCWHVHRCALNFDGRGGYSR